MHISTATSVERRHGHALLRGHTHINLGTRGLTFMDLSLGWVRIHPVFSRYSSVEMVAKI